MIFELPMGWMIAVDFVAWGVIHLGAAWALTQLPPGRFDPLGWLYRPRRWEAGGRTYERLLGVHRWKRVLPDGAALFRRGFRKKRFRSRSPEYLERFRRETCRGELVHWVVMAFAPLFFLWNPPHVGVVMIVYAVLANLPFIVVQRYNRLRLQRVLARQAEVHGRGGLAAVAGVARC
jgi:glycosyl-4,4'-diaponeurosporenoate acyltransferase